MTASTPGLAWVGCSGWSYRSWRGPVYPTDAPSTAWFDCYRTMFDTVEINNTFYHLPTESAVKAWHDQARPGFRYAAKVNRYGTHNKKLRDPDQWLANYLGRMDPLGAFWGPNLVQLPPRWHCNVARLDEFLDAAPAGRRWAVEVRDQSWLNDAVFDTLARHDAALCVHDLLPDHPWLRPASWAYARFHGPSAPSDPYRGSYGPSRLGPCADRLQGWLAQGADVYAYFNNDQGGAAVGDARWLKERLSPSA